MLRRTAFTFLVAACCAMAQPPRMEEHFGFTPGDDYRLADFEQIYGYYQKLGAASARLRISEFGRSSEGRPLFLAVISSEENLKRLDEWRDISRRLALGLPSMEDAARLAASGKVIVWIDSGLHATEVAPAQHAPQLAWRLVTAEDEEIRRIRDRVVLLQVPVINPDGLDKVVRWYRNNLGTPHELAPLPELYQKYAGHDNNRDWFMLNLPETRHVARLLFQEWFPQIVYNQHQEPAFPARIFVPPYAEPLNPRIPPAVLEGIHLIGAAMRERFARENKRGVVSYLSFDAWWNGGLRSAPIFHNMHGILTETAASGYATPRLEDPKDFPPRFANGVSTRQPSIFYPMPWTGGEWRLRDAVEYMLTADMALLELAASRSSQFLMKAWEMAQWNIQSGRAGKPYAYVIPADQHDPSNAREMLWRLQHAGITVLRASSGFTADERMFPAGSWVLPAAQPFRAYLVDLMEPHRYPELHATSGAVQRPYDLTGWTLPLMMGVDVVRIENPFEAALEDAGRLAEPEPRLEYRETLSFVALARLLAQKRTVRRAASGEFLADAQGASEAFRTARWEMQQPRVALYTPKTPNADQGWTQWLLDRFEVPYALAGAQDIQREDLRSRFDVVVFASQPLESLLHGWKDGVPAGRARGGPGVLQKMLPRPEYTGGIGAAGVYRLEQFVRAGGTLICWNESADLVLEAFSVPLRAAGRADGREGAATFYAPGTLVRIDVDNRHWLALGMPEKAVVMVSGGRVFDIEMATPAACRPLVAATYAKTNLLAAGYLSGENVAAGKPALVEVPYGKGRVVLFGFHPQFRAQTFGAFKLLLNAIYMSAAREIGD